ncbi:MAG: hypothetical protein O3C40_34050, partial [Planctomycetota bacterium]|nr:hypothetical protein [Planctomycetota bacterium]
RRYRGIADRRSETGQFGFYPRREGEFHYEHPQRVPPVSPAANHSRMPSNRRGTNCLAFVAPLLQ